MSYSRSPARVGAPDRFGRTKIYPGHSTRAQTWSPVQLSTRLTAWWGRYGVSGAARAAGVDLIDSDSNTAIEFQVDTGEDVGLYNDPTHTRDLRASADAQRPAVSASSGRSAALFDGEGSPNDDYVATDAVSSTLFPTANRGGCCISYYATAIASAANTASGVATGATRLLGDAAGPYWGVYLSTSGVWLSVFGGSFIGIQMPTGGVTLARRTVAVRWDGTNLRGICTGGTLVTAASPAPLDLSAVARVGGQGAPSFSGQWLEGFTFSDATDDELAQMVAYGARWA